MEDTFVKVFAGFVALVISSFLIIYVGLKRKYNYWKLRGVPGPRPTMIFGNFADLFLLKATESEVIKTFCNQFENEKIIGLYYLWTPVLLVKDLGLVKNITETDFDHFMDHPDVVGSSEADSVSNSLFMMKGNVWKDRRLFFTKLFTPKKLKEYFQDMNNCVEVLLKEVDEFSRTSKDTELIKFLEKYTIHCIASTLYGVDLTSDEQRTSNFARFADMFIHPSTSTAAKIILHTVLPNVCNILKIPILPREIWNYVSSFAKELFEARNKNNLERVDIISLLMKLTSEGTTVIEKIEFKEAVGHFFAFFQAGFHTTEVTLSHVLWRLSQHQDVQEKARKEVKTIVKDSERITYEDITKMSYLDNVLCETLRIKPALGVIKRVTTKPYKINENIQLSNGIITYIPVEYLQNHPQYFSEPETYKPERFSSGDNDLTAYMPFGRGPRLCIGMRLAEVEIKKALAEIINRYEVLPSDEMKQPIVFDPKTMFFTNIPIGGLWVKFKKL